MADLRHDALGTHSVGLVPTRMANPANPFAMFDASLIAGLFACLLMVTAAYFLWRMRPATELAVHSEAAI